MQKQKKIKLLFCLNDRGEGKRSCMASGANALRKYAKASVEGESIKVKKAGCLGRCKHGPVIQMLPSKMYYQCTTEADIDLLVQQASSQKPLNAAVDSILIQTDKAAKKFKPKNS